MRDAERLSRSGFSPEFRLAIATSMWPDGAERVRRIEAALESPVDWDLFVRIARRHRIEGLAFHGLSASTSAPEAVHAALRDAAERQANKSLAFAAENLRVSQLLQEAGIPCASLKGASLSMLTFGTLALRHSRDVDLVVPPEHALRADEVLAAAGYGLHMPIGPHSLAQKVHWIRQRKHFEYIGEKNMAMELHWRLFDNPRLLSTELNPATWMEVPIFAKRSLRTLSMPDLLLYLCVHGANHMWFRLKWLADVHALLRQGLPEMLERLEADGKQEGCERAVSQALALMQELYEFPPPEVRPSVNPASSALVKEALQAMTAGKAAAELETIPFATSRIAAARFRLKEGWLFRLAETRTVLADEHDRRSLRVPHSMRFLLPVIRVPMWVWRRLRGQGRSHRGVDLEG